MLWFWLWVDAESSIYHHPSLLIRPKNSQMCLLLSTFLTLILLQTTSISHMEHHHASVSPCLQSIHQLRCSFLSINLIISLLLQIFLCFPLFIGSSSNFLTWPWEVEPHPPLQLPLVFLPPPLAIQARWPSLWPSNRKPWSSLNSCLCWKSLPSRPSRQAFSHLSGLSMDVSFFRKPSLTLLCVLLQQALYHHVTAPFCDLVIV